MSSMHRLHADSTSMSNQGDYFESMICGQTAIYKT